MKALNALFEISPPAVLFHYTSFNAFESIIRTRTLWASNIRYLNDSAEIDHALALANAHFLHYSGSRKSLKPISEFLEGLLRTPGFMARNGSVCVTSFSEDGDTLSQWRGYCPKGLGISIGFDPALFKKFIAVHKNRNESFSKCIYSEREKRDLVEQILRSTCEFDFDDSQSSLETWAEVFAGDIMNLLTVAPLLKHVAFAEEREWRYILRNIVNTNMRNQPAWKFRTDTSTMVPYIEFNLTKNEPLILKELILSPTPHPQRAVDAVELCLATNNVKCENIRVSTIPFRNW